MKKLSLLFLMLMGYCANSMAQSTVPVPADPMGDYFDWIDGNPFQFPDGTWAYSSEFMMWFAQDLSGNFVANDYPGWQAEVEAQDQGITLNYTTLDRDKFYFSIYTDYDEIYVFNPEEYEEFDVPTTMVPYTIFDGPNGDGTSTYSHFESDFVHFESETNHVENIEGKEPFFTWRIGVQAHYIVDGVVSSSNIVYLEVFPRPVLLGDVTGDGNVDVDDVTALISYVLGNEVDPFVVENANVDEAGDVDIDDITALLSVVLGN